jgi:hypothetical protein
MTEGRADQPGFGAVGGEAGRSPKGRLRGEVAMKKKSQRVECADCGTTHRALWVVLTMLGLVTVVGMVRTDQLDYTTIITAYAGVCVAVLGVMHLGRRHRR